MQAIKFVLFLVVAALASSVVVVVIRRRWAAARPAAGQGAKKPPAGTPAKTAAPATGQICPACGQQYPSGLRYCPHDARALVPVGGAAIGGSTLGTQCPRCARLYEADKRFCPFDAEELVSASTAASEVGDRRGGPGGRPSREAAKI